MSRANPISAAANLSELPGQGVRTFISFILFVHFFLLLGAVLGNLSTRSPLMAKLVGIPLVRQYLAVLHLNTAFQYTLADEQDHDVLVVMNVPAADVPAPVQGETEARLRPDQLGAYMEQIKLVPEAAYPGIRQRRYLKLGQLLAQSDDASMTFLANALADGLLKEAGHAPPQTLDAAAPPGSGAGKKEHHLICLEKQFVPLISSGSDPDSLVANAFDRTVYPSGETWSVTSRVGEGEASGQAGGARSRTPARRNGRNRVTPEGNTTGIAPGTPSTFPVLQGSR